MLIQTVRSFAPTTRLSPIDQLFDSFMRTAPLRPGALHRSVPPLNVWQDDQALFIEAELPGMAMKDLDISFQDGDLGIAGSRKSAVPEGATVHRRERGAIQFSRTLHIGPHFDADRAEATLDAGVLTVRIPKAETAKPRKIVVKPRA